VGFLRSLFRVAYMLAYQMRNQSSICSVLVAAFVVLLLPLALVADLADVERSCNWSQTVPVISAHEAPDYAAFAATQARRSWISPGPKQKPVNAMAGELLLSIRVPACRHNAGLDLVVRLEPAHFRVLSDRSPPSSTSRA